MEMCRIQTLAFFFFFIFLHGNSQNTEERAILVDLKRSWNDPPSFSHWNLTSDHCTWPEINCTAGGSVAGITAENHDISAEIPAAICNLKNLTLLDLGNNSIPGTFPTVLRSCSNLQSLNLSNNVFNTSTLPGNINELLPLSLEYLNLEDNNFFGDLPPAVGKLTGLKQLYLGTNLFNGSFPAEIGDLSNLEDLVLNDNPFAPQAIPPSFTKLKNLKNFFMHKINLIGEIPGDIGSLTAMEFFDVAGNMLTGAIPDSLFQIENLTTVYVHDNRFSGSIPQKIQALNLENLDFSNNSLTGPIPEDFGKLEKLAMLNLFYNQLSGGIPESLGLLPNLEFFSVFSNNLSGQLPPEFGNHSVLLTFEVSDNHFSGSLPRDLCKNGALMGVAASNNNLTGEIPESLGNCNTLHAVLVDGNRLSGQIPVGLWAATKIQYIILNNNSFTGNLPEKFSSSLTNFVISNNQFSGRIPAAVSSMINVRKFEASYNRFTGDIPEELTSLVEINFLFLDGNQLSGNFPSKIISWKQINVLNCSRNQLSGEIPGSLGLLPALTDLDLSGNEFSGQIPAQLGGVRSLNNLNLSSNRLSGTIPAAFQTNVYSRSFLENPGLCSNSPSLNLNSCDSKASSNRLSSKFVAAVSTIAVVCAVLAALYAFFMIRSYRKKEQKMQSTWKLTSFHKLDFTASTILSSLTENNLIGSGGSGLVYRVPTGRADGYIAVKKISSSTKLDEKLEKEFLAEVEILGTIRHCNIVKLMCCISTDNSKLLVYEYMENHSLDRWLHRKNRSAVQHVVLDWPKRLQIAIGTAQGLSYMHHDCSPAIIHRDLKSSNILLDSEFNAKVADFGLAKELVKDGEPNTMSVVAGSFGYIAPEYAQTKRVNEKIDVYSFGVILLELVTGKEGNYGDETSSLAQWAWHNFDDEKNIVNAIDEDIKNSPYLEDIITIFRLGVFCTGLIPSKRPTMKEILQVLLRCDSPLSPAGKNDRRSEYDEAPLLISSKRGRSLSEEDDSLNSVV